MAEDRLRIWLGLGKFLVGTVAVGVFSTWISHGIETRQVELKEMEEIGKFVEYALDENVALRLRFAQYFSTVVRSEELRTRWAVYSKLVEEEYAATQDSVRQKQEHVAALEEAVSTGDATNADLESARDQLQEFRSELKVTPWTLKGKAVQSSVREYLELSRLAPLKESPEADAQVLAQLERGELLILLDDGLQKNGYYHAIAEGEGVPVRGWVYRTLVRRRALSSGRSSR